MARPAGEALCLRSVRPGGQALSVHPVLPARRERPSLANEMKPAAGGTLEPPRAPSASLSPFCLPEPRLIGVPGSEPRLIGVPGPRERGDRRMQPACGGLGVRLSHSGWGGSCPGPPAQAPRSPAASAAPRPVAWAWGQTWDAQLPGGCCHVGSGSEVVRWREGPGRVAEKAPACALEGRRLPGTRRLPQTRPLRRHPERRGQVKCAVRHVTRQRTTPPAGR